MKACLYVHVCIMYNVCVVMFTSRNRWNHHRRGQHGRLFLPQPCCVDTLGSVCFIVFFLWFLYAGPISFCLRLRPVFAQFLEEHVVDSSSSLHDELGRYLYSLFSPMHLLLNGVCMCRCSKRSACGGGVLHTISLSVS